MNSVALAVVKLRDSGNNTKLLVPHTSTNQRHFATDTRTYTDSSFINKKISSNFALAFVKSANAVGSWNNSPHKFEMFNFFLVFLSFLVCKINTIPKFAIATMQSLDRDSQLF